LPVKVLVGPIGIANTFHK